MRALPGLPLPGLVRVDVAAVGGGGVYWRYDTTRGVTVVRPLSWAQAQSDATGLRNYGIQVRYVVFRESAESSLVDILAASLATHVNVFFSGSTRFAPPLAVLLKTTMMARPICVVQE